MQPPKKELVGPLPDTLQNQQKQTLEAALAESRGKIAEPRRCSSENSEFRSTLDSKLKQVKIKKHKFFQMRA